MNDDPWDWFAVAMMMTFVLVIVLSLSGCVSITEQDDDTVSGDNYQVWTVMLHKEFAL